MIAHLEYLRYLMRHKWFVFLACCRLGIPLLGILHDLSKFRPAEWGPYVEFFFGTSTRVIRNATGYYKPSDTGDEDFDMAVFRHVMRNKHHWQAWVLPVEHGEVQAKRMPTRYVREMVADWRSAGRAQGKPDTLAWYRQNGPKLMLHQDTRAAVEVLLGVAS